MHLLALPEDEQEIIRHLCEEEGLQLLSDLLQKGSPRVATDPLDALASDLPSRNRHGRYRLESVLQIRPTSRCGSTCCGQAPSASSEHSQTRQQPETLWTGVALRLDREATEQWRDLIDLTRTPVVGLRRTSWHHREDCLIAGALTTTRTRVRDLPREVAWLHSRVERHLQRRSRRLDPFDTCRVYTRPAPAWTLVRQEAGGCGQCPRRKPGWLPAAKPS